jgi:hypothetical protein
MNVTRRLKRVGRTLGFIGAAAATLGLLLLTYPYPLFLWSAKSGGLSLYADRPFAPEAGRRLLERVEAKLARSPLRTPGDRHDIFVCSSAWRRRLFFPTRPTTGGVNYYPVTTSVFLSGAVVEENRLISPSGKPDVFGRTLDHFIAHEIAHTLTARATGSVRFHLELSSWVKEGYAEYVGRGGGPTSAESVRALLAEAPEMNVPPQAPYLRWTLLVACLLDEKGWPVLRLLDDTLTASEVAAMIKAENPRPQTPGD